MSFYPKKEMQELIGEIKKEPTAAERYIERCAQNVANSVIRDKQKGVPPQKAIAHMMAKFNKYKRRMKDEPKKLNAIRKRIMEILQTSPEMKGPLTQPTLPDKEA